MSVASKELALAREDVESAAMALDKAARRVERLMGLGRFESNRFDLIRDLDSHGAILARLSRRVGEFSPISPAASA